MPERSFALSLVESINLSLSKLSLLQRMAFNDNGKRKLEEEAESLTSRKRLHLSNNDSDDDDSSDSLEEDTMKEEEEEKVSLEESSMKLDTSKEKLLAKRGHGVIFSYDGDTTLPSSEPRTPKSCVCYDLNTSDDDDDNDDNDDDDF
jgi:hypothetical protein